MSRPADPSVPEAARSEIEALRAEVAQLRVWAVRQDDLIYRCMQYITASDGMPGLAQKLWKELESIVARMPSVGDAATMARPEVATTLAAIEAEAEVFQRGWEAKEAARYADH